MAFDPKADFTAELALSKLSSCITDIHEWMTRNMLMLNNSKTEFFLAASPHNLAKLRNVSLQISENKISPSSKIKKKKKKNLGVIFDQTMSMKDHVNTIVKTVNFHIRRIYRIRRFVTVDSCYQLVRPLNCLVWIMRTHFCMELRPKIGGSYRSFKTRQTRLSLGVTDFILLRPCRESFTGYQLMRESSSKCCS